jgi:hypothetical protein
MNQVNATALSSRPMATSATQGRELVEAELGASRAVLR